MTRWPRSRSVQVLISLFPSAIAAVIAFPVAERYLVWYYSRDPGAIHDGQTGLLVIVGAGATSLAVFAGILLLALIVQQIKTGGFSKKQ
jgi:hypothetical protein